MNFLDPDDESFFYGNIPKPIKLTDRLSQKYGGKWKKVPRVSIWECNDNIRYVADVLTGRDMNGEYDGSTTMYLYYKDNRPTEQVFL